MINNINLLGSCWLEINLDIIKHNILSVRKLVGKQRKIMGVVKANGYGHDSTEVSKIILENGADELAVARIEEAIVLRKNNIKAPILVLGIVPKELMGLLFEYQIKPTICDLSSLYELNNIASKLQKKIKIHLKVDTGMGRLGIQPFEIREIVSEINKMSNIKIEGVYSHFATADEKDKSYAQYQFNVFKQVMDLISKNVFPRPYFHIANSGAILDLPETWLDIVRPGCIIYGFYPSQESQKVINLVPALCFKSRIVFIKTMPNNSFIGYGKTYKTSRDTKIATISVGYADGYNRLLSNLGKMLIKGKRVSVLGRVCMDQIMVDITDIENVKVGDEVIIWGGQRENNISLEEIALQLNTIIDEIVHLTDKERVAKLFIKQGKPWKVKNSLGEHCCA